MRRRFLLALAVALVTGIVALPALANGNGAQTFTEHETNVTQTFADFVPCADGDIPALITTVTKSRVFHMTLEPGAEIVGTDPVTGEPIIVGEFHVTFTEVGTFEAVAAQGVFEGHFAIWGGFNNNGQNGAGTFTFEIEGFTPTGTQFGAHAVEHFNTSASTPPSTREFFHVACSHGGGTFSG